MPLDGPVPWVAGKSAGAMIINFAFRPLRAKLFIENIKMYLQFISFFHADMTQVVDILPHIIKELIYSTLSISGWVLISRRRKEPGHQQQWYWLCWRGIIRSRHVKGFNIYVRNQCFEGLHPIQEWIKCILLKHHEYWKLLILVQRNIYKMTT